MAQNHIHPTSSRQMNRYLAFTMIELIIVVVIIGIIGAVAIPRISRGAESASESALKRDLQVLNSALDLYAAEHNGEHPNPTKIVQQLTQYTSPDGNTSPTKDASHYLGPYIRESPPLPVGTRKGMTGITTTDQPTSGWIYQPAKQRILPNFLPERTEEQTEDIFEELVKDVGDKIINIPR